MSKNRLRRLLPLITTVLALILPLLLFALAAPLSAATLCVRPGGGGGCYASIQDAVNAAGDGDTIEVHTGTYNESVDLAQAAGDITVVAVDGPGTVTVNGGANPAFYTSVAHAGNVTIDGFVVHSSGLGIRLELVGDADIRNVTANSTGDSGIAIGPAGNVSVSDCATNDTAGFGIGVGDDVGDVTITNCTANNNAMGGIAVGFADEVTVTNCTAHRNHGNGITAGFSGDFTVTNCTANSNGTGIWSHRSGDFTVTNCTANNNDSTGIGANLPGNVTIFGSVALGNENGVKLENDIPSGSVNGSIICGNECGLYLRDGPVSGLNAEGNWWGCPGGPEDAACDPICQEDSVAVDFDPWIDTITVNAPPSAEAGQPAVVSFQFSDSVQTVFLGEGPGDLHGDPTFRVTAQGGTITEGGFINAPNGVMEVTVVPDLGGAMVTVDGPCRLDAEVCVGGCGFVPEPASVLLFASGLMGLAGYAGLRLRKK